MYNEFDPKHYKGKWPCTIKTLYNEKTLIGRLHQYTECILLCMFLCKSWLFQIYEYHCPDCFEADTGFITDAAGISVGWWYNGI